ncbi:hypothetical protein L227DRAFT_579938 [Lentinus tigrinus ALCF2SS1-6]|uniref:DUF6697 domain-containing protein n=2 Tax=Lentinus tigrinus TaxID=5365 RepID=A0A5C2RW95_9APHY|nr:hypothetical protein L227DRAFT_579938 [Lentinus tigrinus ALCF2SS1-6]
MNGGPSRKRRRKDANIFQVKSDPDKKPSKQELLSVPSDDLDKHWHPLAGSVASEQDVTPESRIKNQAETSTAPGTLTRSPTKRRPTRFEIVLPSLRDVRHRQAEAAAAAQAALQDDQVQVDSGIDTHRSVTVKPEPIEDERQHFALPQSLDQRDPQILRTAIEDMRNPDVKIKKELLLSDEFLLDALTWEGINRRYPIPVPQEIAERGFSRPYISHLYGGNLRATYPSPSPDMLEWHGLDDWAFLNLNYCPHAPTRPGYSGLHFSSYRARDTWEKLATPLRTFVKLASSRWVYMGQYQFAPGKSLTTTAWMEQRPEVRKTWATGLLNKQWGRNVLLRVWFRKIRGADYEPTKEDMADATVNIKDIRKAMTEQEIIDAYTRGEEEIGTYTMTCVGYDEQFVRVLGANAHRFVATTPRTRKGQSGKKTKGARRDERAEDPEEDGMSGDEHESAPKDVVTTERRSTRQRVKRVRTS